MIRNIEELSLNAWPSLQTMSYDGWILRFADGYTKRANSVNPLYFSNIAVDEKIQFCEAVYPKKNLPIVFKITSSVHPHDLDEQLHARGYDIDSPTSLQTIDLNAVNVPSNAEAELQDELSGAWLENYCRMNVVPIVHRRTLETILVNIVPKHTFVSIKANNRIVACGLGVLQSGYLGLFDIVTDKDFRKRGFGQQVVNSILDWGKQSQAHTGYLQVMLNNSPALNLYRKIGFVEKYQYWYRIKS